MHYHVPIITLLQVAWPSERLEGSNFFRIDNVPAHLPGKTVSRNGLHEVIRRSSIEFWPPATRISALTADFSGKTSGFIPSMISAGLSVSLTAAGQAAPEGIQMNTRFTPPIVIPLILMLVFLTYVSGLYFL